MEQEESNQSSKGFVVFDQQLAGLLMFMKHRLKKCRADRDDITKNVFIFDINDTFEKDLKYLKEHKNKINI